MSDAAAAGTDADPLGPGSMLHRLTRQARWGLVATRAIVLEAAHPQIGAALITNSTFVAHPWRRLRNTVLSAQRMVDPDIQVRQREAARLNRMHARITGIDAEGRPFNAADSEARAWVVATLFESTVTMCRLSGESLDGPALDRLYAEFRAFLALMDPYGGKLPPTMREFWRYYARAVEERLENTEAVHIILDRLFAQVPAPTPSATGPAGRVGGGQGARRAHGQRRRRGVAARVAPRATGARRGAGHTHADARRLPVHSSRDAAAAGVVDTARHGNDHARSGLRASARRRRAAGCRHSGAYDQLFAQS
ncbi:oxygenase MpaB family protein [Microbispora sp. CA-135349]|uniref:oxygenase MpaB family protein n=1 Tax=Microbispora sp. CA-135349 TaxID=3239953 RepID=UPI003D94F386